MRKSTKIILFTGLGILCAGILVCIIAFALNGFQIRRAPSGTAGIPNERHEFEGEIPEEIQNLEIEMTSENISVKPSSDGRTYWSYQGPLEKEDLIISSERGTFTLRWIDSGDGVNWNSPAQILDNILFFAERWIDHAPLDIGGKLTLYLSEKEYDSLTVRTASGELLVESGLSFQSVVLNSVSGEIDVQKITGLKDLLLSSTSGDISAKETEVASDFLASSVSGEISVRDMNVAGKAGFSTTSGSILLKDSLFHEAKIDTTSGKVLLDEIQSETCTAETVSGDVRGTIDADTKVLTKTVSGDVRVPNGSKGDWSVKTISGDILLEGSTLVSK